MQVGMRALLSERMSNAWRIARSAASTYGGKASEYIAQAMRQDVQQAMRGAIAEERKNEKAFDNFAADLQDMMNDAVDRIRKPGWKARAEQRRDQLYETLGGLTNAQKSKLGTALRQSEQLTKDVKYAMAVYAFDSDQDNIDDSVKSVNRVVDYLKGDAPDAASALTSLINDMAMYRTIFGEDVAI